MTCLQSRAGVTLGGCNLIPVNVKLMKKSKVEYKLILNLHIYGIYLLNPFKTVVSQLKSTFLESSTDEFRSLKPRDIQAQLNEFRYRTNKYLLSLHTLVLH